MPKESAALAGISSVTIQGLVALERRAGARVWRVGEEPDGPWVFSTVPQHAHLAGLDLHANLAVPAGDRARLEQLCRYLLRPAVAQERLRLLDDGRVLLSLKTAWAGGTRHLLFEPLELLEKLAALTPLRIRVKFVRSSPASRARPSPWVALPLPGTRSPRTRPLTSALDRSARSPRLRRGLFTTGLARGRNTPARRLRGPRCLLLLTSRYPRCIRMGDSSSPWAVVRSVSGGGKLRQEAFVPPMFHAIVRRPII